MKLEKILSDIETYLKENQTKSWTPGKDWVQYAGPYFSSDEYVRAIKTLLEGWLVLGKDALEFERIFPKELGKKYGILTNSGSSSNLIMMKTLTSKRGMNLSPGTKVITPVAGFPTTINPIYQCSFEPVFVDIELPSLNLNLDQVENSEGAVLCFAHALGNPPDMGRVQDIMARKHMILIEDCCDALGSMYDNKPVGSFGKMSSCSFYPAHHITMGEGGFVATDNKETEYIARSFREWGRGCYCTGKEAGLSMKGSCGKRFQPWIKAFPDEIFDHKYIYEEIGYNLKPIELQASIGLEQLKKLPEIKRLRIRNYNLLLKIFKKYEEFFYLPVATKKANPSWFTFPVTLKEKAPFSRNALCTFLEENKIQTRPYFAGNVLLHPAYEHLMPTDEAKTRFPVATYATLNTFFLGTSPVITPEKIDYIEQTLTEFFKKL